MINVWENRVGSNPQKERVTEELGKEINSRSKDFLNQDHLVLTPQPQSPIVCTPHTRTLSGKLGHTLTVWSWYTEIASFSVAASQSLTVLSSDPDIIRKPSERKRVV